MKPNDKFKLTVRDIELIERALQGKISRRGISVALDPDSVYAPELQAEVDEMRDLLGRIHNQKVWYTPKDGRFQGGG
jgi:hypothetical protein|tara:strand:+ start:1298 stop:1528 length:231 start_codon:yes stop_codon:yes gene_type:complete